MKIAVYFNLPPGGALTCIRNILNHLPTDIHIDIYTPTYCNFQQARHNISTISERMHIPKGLINQYFFIRNQYYQYQMKLSKIFNSKYDAVVCTHDYLTKSPMLLQQISIPNIYICHEPPREFNEDPRLFEYKKIHKLVNVFRKYIKNIDIENVSAASLIITNSAYSKKVIKKYYDRDAVIIPMGVEPKAKISENEYTKRSGILSVGAFDRIKGYDFLLDVVARYNFEKNEQFTFAGYSGRELHYVKQRIKKENLNVVLKVDARDQEIEKLYRKSKLFIFASHNEPYGLVLLETISYGIPAVAVDEGGVREIINNTNGEICTRNVTDFCISIDHQLKKTNYLRSLNIQQSSLKYSWSTSASRLYKLLAL